MTMPDSHAHEHGDEGGIDVEPYMERALEDIVDTILMYGEYPRPASSYPYPVPTVRQEFSLYDWILENIDEDQLRSFYFLQVTSFNRDHSKTRGDETDIVTEALKESLRDSQIVTDKAAEMAEEDE